MFTLNMYDTCTHFFCDACITYPEGCPVCIKNGDVTGPPMHAADDEMTLLTVQTIMNFDLDISSALLKNAFSLLIAKASTIDTPYQYQNESKSEESKGDRNKSGTEEIDAFNININEGKNG